MRKLLLSSCLTLLVLNPGALSAQIGIGGQLSWADDADLGIGARAAFSLPTKAAPLEIIATFDYFFPDDAAGLDVTYWELNGNVVYLFDVPAPKVTPYAGAGLNLAHGSVDAGTPGTSVSDTELGLNFLGGARFDLGSVTPFGELRVELDGGEQFLISAGVLFSVGPGL